MITGSTVLNVNIIKGSFRQGQDLNGRLRLHLQGLGGWPADKQNCLDMYKECNVKLGLDPAFYAKPPRPEDWQFFFPISSGYLSGFPLRSDQTYYLKKWEKSLLTNYYLNLV